MILSGLFLLSSLLSLACGLDIKGSIVSNVHLSSPAFLPPSTLLIVSSTNLEYKTHPSPSGSFTFRNVSSGPSYLLEVECLTHTFSPLRIDTRNEEVEVYQTFRGNAWSHRGAQLATPVQVQATGKADYYVPRSGFKIDVIFKSPMLLLAMFSLAIVFLIPKLTSSLDPEALAEYRAREVQGPQLPSFDIASFMAGSSKKPAAVEKTRKAD